MARAPTNGGARRGRKLDALAPRGVRVGIRSEASADRGRSRGREAGEGRAERAIDPIGPCVRLKVGRGRLDAVARDRRFLFEGTTADARRPVDRNRGRVLVMRFVFRDRGCLLVATIYRVVGMNVGQQESERDQTERDCDPIRGQVEADSAGAWVVRKPSHSGK